MSEAVSKLANALKDQPKNPLRNHQVEEYTHEQARLKEIIQAPAYVSGDRGTATKRYNEVSKLVESQIAKPLHGARKAEVAPLAAAVCCLKSLPKNWLCILATSSPKTFLVSSLELSTTLSSALVTV